MICPSCGAEYREGFTRCHDCDVPLVSSLEEAEAGEAVFTGEDALVPFHVTRHPELFGRVTRNRRGMGQLALLPVDREIMGGGGILFTFEFHRFTPTPRIVHKRWVAADRADEASRENLAGW